jgi:hypothetical protein
MARIYDPFAFTGTLANISAYKMRGVEGYILRTKGGPSKNKIKTSPKFERTRQNNKEFGIRSFASKQVMDVLHPLKSVADYNIAGPLNSLLRHAQQLDTESPAGERSVLLSKIPALLNNFSLNRKNPFDSVVHAPISLELNARPFSATISIPKLIPNINLRFPAKYSLYSFIAVFGLVPDTGFGAKRSMFVNNFSQCPMVVNYSGWYGCMEGNESYEFNLTLPEVDISGNDFSLLSGIGLRYGQAVAPNVIEQVRYAGCAKVLSCLGILKLP